MVSCLFVLALSLSQQDTLVRHYLEIGEIEKAAMLVEEIGDTFVLGEIAYFSYEFDEAVEYYNKVPKDSWDANNALYRVILIKESKDAGLEDYVTAELLGRQQKQQEAIKILNQLKDSTSSIVPWAVLLLADFFKQEKRLEDALKEYLDFVEKFEESDLLPQAWLKLGELYIELGKIDKAREAYRKILLDYPKSSVAPVARERLEEL